MQYFLKLVRMYFIKKKSKTNLKGSLRFNKQGNQPSSAKTEHMGTGVDKAIQSTASRSAVCSVGHSRVRGK